ncbi:hypothetical protein M0805_007255 [Coniferiporia weirii]|nr:hypothetical protein M0805_007255 [Coniferiporia weirii]
MVLKSYKHWKHMAVDANFHLVGDQAGLDEHLRKFGHIKVEKSTCSKFVAMENQNTVKNRKQNASGAAMVLCKHGLGEAQGAVNLQFGERQINVNYALAGALIRKNLLNQIILAYDIGCQYCIKLLKRFKECFPDDVGLIHSMKILVGKMHLNGHIDSCQFGFSFNYTYGVGRTDGEEVEQWRAEANQVARIGDWNWTKLQNQGNVLECRISVARETAEEKKICFKDHSIRMHTRYGVEAVKQWEAMDTAPYKNEKGEWDSVFHLKIPYPSKALVLQHMALEEDSKSMLKLMEKLAMFVSMGLSLQHRQRALKAKMAKSNTSFSEVRSIHTSLECDLKKWRARQVILMPSIFNLLDEVSPVDNVEDEDLRLPSSFSADEQESYGFIKIVQCEYKLWEGEAHDALQNLRVALRDLSFQENRWCKYGLGKQGKTQAANGRKAADEEKRHWSGEYRTCRSALISLGMEEADHVLQPLTDEDTWHPSTLEPHKFGTGKRVDGWIWTMGRDVLKVDAPNWEKEDDRVHWFRLRASRDWWIEEVMILEEELRRLTCGLNAMADTWKNLSKNQDCSGDLGSSAYAARKSAIYRVMSEDACKCLVNLGLCKSEPDDISMSVRAPLASSSPMHSRPNTVMTDATDSPQFPVQK